MNNELPVFTRTFENASDFRPESGSVYVCGRTSEERSEHHVGWSAGTRDVRICDVVVEGRDTIEVTESGAGNSVIALRSRKQLVKFWEVCPEKTLYVDITGLRHGTWAALLRGVASDDRQVRVVYVEPYSYRMSPQPTQNEIYDLSERINGIAPLPGYARIRTDTASGLFVPLLGWEGTRLQYVMNQLEPPGQLVFPIVGVPGFRAEYPFITYWANRTALRESQAWRKVRYAPANCPFSTFNVLRQLHLEHADQCLTIAPIGTKPQALAAVMYALRHPSVTEIVYDHPVRKRDRTEGISRLHVYEITGLLRN